MLTVVVVLLLCCFSTRALADFEEIKYTGSFTSSASAPRFHPPSWDGTTCQANSGFYTYKWFSLSFNESWVWHVVASAEVSIQDKLRVYIYTSFDPALPCNSLLLQRALVQQPLTSAKGGPTVSDFIYLHHPSYVVVVSVPLGITGTFGINMLPASKSGTTVGAPLWPIAVMNSGTCQKYTTTLSTPFAYYTWTQPTDGLYDIYAMFDSPLTSWFSFIALFNSGLTWQQLQTPCNVNGAGKYLIAASGAVQAKGAGLWYLNLRAKTTYTIAFSGYGSAQIGYYGIRIVPTQVLKPFQSPFVQPQRGIPQCYSDPYNDDSSWNIFQFKAEYGAYLIDTVDVVAPLQSFDTYSFLYLGANAGTPPIGCPYFAQLLTQADTGDAPLTQLTTIGANYTAVISTYSGKQTGTGADYAYILYVITGDYIPDNQPAHPSASGCSQVLPSVIILFTCLFLIYQ